MSSNLRVDRILPSTGTEVGVGTATGSVALYGDVNVAGTLTYEDVTNIDSVGIVTARSGLHVTSGSVGIGTDDPDELLEVGNGTVSGALKVSGQSSSVTSGGFTVDWESSSNSTRIFSEPSSGGSSAIRFFTTNSGTRAEKLRITSAGQMGLGTNSPNQKLHLHAAGSGGNKIKFTNDTTATGASDGFTVGIDGSENAELRLDEATNMLFVTNSTEKVRITSGGQVRIGNSTISASTSADDLIIGLDSPGGDRGVTIISGTSGTGNIFFSDTDTSGVGNRMGTITYDHSGNFMRFSTAGNNERLRITSGGEVIVNGTATGSNAKFEVKSTSGSISSATARINGGDTATGAINTGASLLFAGHAGDVGRDFASIFAGKENGTSGNYSAYLSFGTRSNGTPLAERVRIDSSGNMQVSTGQFTVGTTASTGLQLINDGTFGTIQSADLKIRTAATERLRITSDGKLGINVTSPGCQLGGIHAVHDATQGTPSFTGAEVGIFQRNYNGAQDCAISIVSGTNASSTINFGDKDDVNPGIIEYMNGSNAMRFSTNAGEAMRIDSSGRLLVGTLNSTGTQLIKVNGDTGGTTYGGHIALTQGRTSPGNGATHGVLSFGTETRPEVVKVVSFVDGTWTDGQYHPSGLYIATTDYNRNSPTEKIRITDIGEVNCYSTGSVIQAGTLQGGGYNVYFYEGRRNQNTGGTRTYIVWSNGNVQNTNNSYGSLSDQRLKENIVDATSQWDDIKSLQIRKYNFREATGNETHTQLGLIAQEVESVSPGLVQTTAVGEGEVLQDADGNQIESVKSINYSVLYMKSVKALQEAQTRIEALEAAVAALQGS